VATQAELLAHLWRALINSQMDASQLHAFVVEAKLRPNDPFADTGPAIERLLALGASERDICIIRRDAAYRAVFGTLYSIGDPGIDDDDVFMLHESLLTADPSGMDGRPGSSDAV
jgi:hypothetical protein